MYNSTPTSDSFFSALSAERRRADAVRDEEWLLHPRRHGEQLPRVGFRTEMRMNAALASVDQGTGAPQQHVVTANVNK
eukprot:3693547-Pyramimonas_sp.AAC.1